MKVITQDQYLEIKPLKNGWLLRYYDWDKEQLKWIEQDAYCYQDFEVMIDVLKDSLKEERA